VIGNDIIDWSIARTQHQKLRQRCLEKLFNPPEIDAIKHSKHPLRTYWVLWSVKESAYKAWQRETNAHPIYNPKAFHINGYSKSLNQMVSTIRIEAFSINVKTELNADYIYSYCDGIAVLNAVFTLIEWNRYKIQLLGQGWEMGKIENNIPVITRDENTIKIPVSISHDGKYVALNLQKYFAK